MIDLDKFLSLFYERDDPVMCYVWICVFCVLCVLCGVWCVAFGLVCFSFLFFSFDFWAFILFSFFFSFSLFMGWFGRRLAWHGMGWMGYKANSASGYHIYPFSIDISDNHRHDLIVYTQSVYLMIFIF